MQAIKHTTIGIRDASLTALFVSVCELSDVLRMQRYVGLSTIKNFHTVICRQIDYLELNQITKSMEQTINERIKQICDYYFAGNVSEMARTVLVKQSTIRDIVGTKQSKPSFETLKAIVDCPTIKVSASWLLVGTGNVFDETKGCFYFEFDEDNEPRRVEHLEEPPKNGSSILQTRPRIPYTAAAGSLTNAMNGITEDQCEQIPRINIFPEYDFTIIIKGDSMEPKYEGGDEVACKRIDSTSFIQWGKVHVLDTAQGILIKRTYEDGEKIRCVSYNSEYPDFSIDKSEIYSMSLVVGLIRL